MSGFGDNIHQRAAIRDLLDRGTEIWLETPVPVVYEDLAATGRLHFLNVHTWLRTQAKNEKAECRAFTAEGIPLDVPCKRVGYNGTTVRDSGSVLAAICRSLEVDPAVADFRMPVPTTWRLSAPIPPRPYILYRPPVARSEWGGAAPRNPDPEAYAAIFEAIRGDRCVVSVADLKDGEEWIVGPPVRADMTLHAGELNFRQLAAMTRCADHVYTTPGLITVLAQAVETPCITVFGGYETAMSYSGGARWSPWLPIEADRPCGCWQHDHACDKRIDVPAAINKIESFLGAMDGSRKAA